MNRLSDFAAHGLTSADRLLSAIVSSSDDAIISKTIDGNITSWNDGAERMFGYTADEVIGGPISILAVPGHEAEMPGFLEVIRRRERIDHFETWRRHKNGTLVLVSLTVSPILDDNGQVIGASKVARDITAARWTSQALAKAELQLQQQHRELLHTARLGELGQMSATLAHEVSQPLGALLNYLGVCEILIADPARTDMSVLRDAMQAAMVQVQRASKILQRLQAFARPGQAMGKVEPISGAVREGLALATIDAARLGVKVEIECEAEDILVKVDRVELQQVILNLVRNGIQSMEGAATKNLRVLLHDAGAQVEISISDTGCGLSNEITGRIFEPFVTTKPEGLGLGLSICQKIIESYAGRLWVKETGPQGTTFTFGLNVVGRSTEDGGLISAVAD